MANGYQALTEKEKQTLRLLISGYDAKSMARHLGLSVHTINERLRDARRKLATSSSREAARLLHEQERQSPQLLGDKQLGDAAGGAPVDAVPIPARVPDAPRRLAWGVGVIAMSLSLALLAYAALSGGAQSSATAAQSAALPDQSSSLAAAQRFLSLIDADNWSAGWRALSETMRSNNTLQGWTTASQQVRARFGQAGPRELIGNDDVPAPPGGVQFVRFRTHYARQDQVIEKLVLVREHGEWKVAGITLE